MCFEEPVFKKPVFDTPTFESSSLKNEKKQNIPSETPKYLFLEVGGIMKMSEAQKYLLKLIGKTGVSSQCRIP